jgi:class 3 adenylate cyclase
MLHHPLTFLFTDLEGSTSLWENFPDEMREAVARHDVLMCGIIEKHRGRVVKTTGDGFHAVLKPLPTGLLQPSQDSGQSWRNPGLRLLERLKSWWQREDAVDASG